MNSVLPRRRAGSGAGAFETSVLGLGCASFWARRSFPESSARAVLERALEAGITLLDTGASYAKGHAEQRLGRLLRQLGADPDRLEICTKIGTVHDPRGRPVKDFAPPRIVDQTAASLDRLGLERVRVLHLHGPLPQHLTDDLRRALERVLEAGLTDRIGVNGHRPALEAVLDDPLFSVLMPFLSVREPGDRDLIRAAGDTGRAVLAAGPLARMSFRPPLLDWLSRSSGRWYLARALARSPRSLLGGRSLRHALRDRESTPAQLALAWVLEQPGVTATVFGTTRPEHVTELARAAARPLPDTVRRRLRALIDGDPA
ncbi:MAG: aldo/keto reductase [Wenzhouxiangellaceae bacterium]